MQLRTIDYDPLMDVMALRVAGNGLVIGGRIMSALPIQAVLPPDQTRVALKLLDVKTVLFLLTILFRRGK
ncbi:MAG: hypothetical protein P8Y48_17920 [Novosphingobium sp.]